MLFAHATSPNLIVILIVVDSKFVSMSDGKIIIDSKRAVEIGKILHDGFERKTGFFKYTPMPEYIPPDVPEGSRELALYFTYVMALDYQTKADRLWSRSREQFNKRRDLFEPEVILSMDYPDLVSLVKSLGGRYPNNGARAWRRISSLLLEDYGGDPRNIASEPTSLREIKSRLSPFPSLRGPKVGRVYTRIMGEKGLFKVSDLDSLDVAIDVQITRFTFFTGALKAEGHVYSSFQSPRIKNAIEGVWRKAASEIKCPPWKLDEPIWTIASNLCSHPFKCGMCPVEKLCLKDLDYGFQEGKLWHEV